MKKLPFGQPLSCKQKPEIDYPCNWLYKVIGSDPDLVKKAITEIGGTNLTNMSYSHSSSSGKYHSFNAEIEVIDEQIRLAICQDFKNHPDIKFIL